MSTRFSLNAHVFMETDGTWIARSQAGNIGKGSTHQAAVEDLERFVRSLPVRDLEAAPRYPEVDGQNGVTFIARATVIETRGFLYRQWVWELKE